MLIALSSILLVVAFIAVFVIWRLPRRAQAQIIREFWSPLVVAASGRLPRPHAGPVWRPEWEAYADVTALREAVSISNRRDALADASVENTAIQVSRLDFAYQDFADRNLAALARELQLEQCLSGASGDLDVFRRVNTFVRGVAEHTEEGESHQMSYEAPDDAWSILAAVRRGETMQCHAYTLLLVQCLAALGYTARQCSCGYFLPREHVVVEAWSPELLKWILLDPDYDLTYARDGVPLSAYDAQQTVLHFERAFREWTFATATALSGNPIERKALLGEFLSMRPELLDGVQVVRGGSTSRRIPFKMSRSPTRMCLEVHRSFAVSLRNDHLSIRYPFGHPRRSGQAALAAGSARWLSGYDGTLTDDLADLYWSLHAVRLGFQPSESGAVRVLMGTFTPGFKCFRVSINDRIIEMTEGTILWPLESGTNCIEVSAVNERGRAGKSSRAMVRMS